MNNTSTIARPRPWRLQFSLRLLLLAFTGFAIGFPIWYRWPYETVIEQRDSTTGALQVTRIATRQRQWGGGNLSHGPERIIAGDFTRTTHYVLGKRHGPYSVRDAKGRSSDTGQYANDLKDGTWIESHGKIKATTTWHRGKLDGPMEWTIGDGKTIIATFVAGRLTSYNGQAVDDLTFDVLNRRELDERTAAELKKETTLDVVEFPLKDIVVYLGEMHQIPIEVESVNGPDGNLPLTGTYRGLELRSALTLITVPHGLACDCRYGSLCITTAEDAKYWRDPTGVSEIVPPKGSALIRPWNEPAIAAVTTSPLAEVLATIAQPLAIAIDTTQVRPTAGNPNAYATVANTNGIPFRHALGRLLYETGCRCRLEGEKARYLAAGETMSVVSTPPSTRRRWLRPQFSLRLLLLAFTGFAIGFPIWYRWPYEETEVNRTGTSKQISTWQRQWGGGRLKHGLQRQISGGKTIESLEYRNGLRHGPYESSWASGEFVNDQKEGVWTAPDRTSTWRHGKLHGPYELLLPPVKLPPMPKVFSKKDLLTNDPRKFQLMFSEGRLTHFNGQPAASRLFDRMEDGSMDQRVRNELDKFTTMDFVEIPLYDCVEYLTALHNIPIAIDPSLVTGQNPGYDMPITEEFRGIDLCSALTLMTAPHGLGCDYRYGSLWITAGEDTNDWHDPTGVSEIKPPSDSMLARVWNESVNVRAVQMPLTDVVAYLEERLPIKIDTSRVKPNPPRPFAGTPPNPSPPIATSPSMPFRHVLGQVLYRTGCRCKLEGETLVILPPEGESP